ncbi:FAD-dependent monooxygenase [Streptomyces bobili]|uniref:FAD-dependent monooxygenase n=1 Tax=Streptomyces bobili TaxID=67280 RepID=UPI003F4E1EC3
MSDAVGELPGRSPARGLVVGHVGRGEVERLAEVARQRTPRLGGRVVAVFRAEAGQESWTASAGPGEQVREFEGWDPRVRTLLGQAGQVFRHGLSTRAPLTRWNVGRVTLLGDSAHAMVPFQAQGAAQAILDAVVLGDALAAVSPAEVPEALHRYVARRIGSTTRVRAGSTRAGEDYHLPDGPEADARNSRLVSYGAENRIGPHAAVWAADILAEEAPS